MIKIQIEIIRTRFSLERVNKLKIKMNFFNFIKIYLIHSILIIYIDAFSIETSTRSNEIDKMKQIQSTVQTEMKIKDHLPKQIILTTTEQSKSDQQKSSDNLKTDKIDHRSMSQDDGKRTKIDSLNRKTVRNLSKKYWMNENLQKNHSTVSNLENDKSIIILRTTTETYPSNIASNLNRVARDNALLNDHKQIRSILNGNLDEQKMTFTKSRKTREPR